MIFHRFGTDGQLVKLACCAECTKRTQWNNCSCVTFILAENFSANVKEMLGHYPKLWWRICWKYISPVLIAVSTGFNLTKRWKYFQYHMYFRTLFSNLAHIVSSHIFVLQGVLIFSFVRYERAKYGSYVYPMWADFTGWIFVFAAILPVFIIAILRFYHAEGPTYREVRVSFYKLKSLLLVR